MGNLKLIILGLAITLLVPKNHLMAKQQTDNYRHIAAEDSTKAEQPPEAPEIPQFNFKFELSPSQEKELLKDIMPKLKKELEGIKKLNKMKYFTLLQDLHFRNLDIPFFGKRNKEAIERSRKIGELEVETESLGLKYQNADKPDKSTIKTDLKNKLNELFELRESNRKEEVGQLENRLSELKKTLQERRENKEEIVKKRMLELLGESKNIEW
jgi:hypothetical protein